ncbi:NAD(+) diphosphatase [Gephyromycinifex aptenodytis]|uniref:NAD(+) diphosphatase n=1 Tax=Gephyromycinifex aptenodytis TaxID=2716227 RepID=UPI001447360C|nr:NAD(+) diphosphatase [Gephyromycinifex aptenodytis]
MVHTPGTPPAMAGVLDRSAGERTDPDTLPRLLADPRTRVLEMRGGRTRVQGDPGAARLSLRRWQGDDETRLVVFLGRDSEGVATLGVIDTENEAELDPEWRTLRDTGPWLAADDLERFMTAQGLASWHASHRFCPRCGADTTPGGLGWVRNCSAEGRELYPRTDPAVIMAVLDQRDRILLARSPAWPSDRRSVLAGFVEPGESLESAVRREVQEEVGVRVGEVAYVGSQPWPFPGSLMVGFQARALDTELVLEESEIAQAEWYEREQVRQGVAEGSLLLPGRLSISRHLIQRWYGPELFVPGVDEPGGGERWSARS